MSKRTVSGSESVLLTLRDVASRTGIPMPTLHRYKKRYQDRIPAVGQGRGQRYPAEAPVLFEQIKQENLRRGGRPRKSGSAGDGSKPAVRRKASGPVRSELLTLTAHRHLLSHPSALGDDSRAAASSDSSLARRVGSLEQAQETLARQIRDLLHEFKKPIPMSVTVRV